MKRLYSLGAIVLFAQLMVVRADEPVPKDKQHPEAVAFREYLAKSQPKKKWQMGPSLLDSAELEKAYPGRRFVFIYSTAPLPPGANIPEIQRRFQEQVQDIRANYLSMTVGVVKMGEAWKITPYAKPADFNLGLMKVAADDDARLAAAAILALVGIDQVTPRAVGAKEVKVTKTEKGWTCQVQRQNSFQGMVIFNAKGECTAVSKNYAGPFPP